jgi:uncharacterized protein (DUF1697 family)
MAELREIVTSLGHADVMTYIQSGNVLFTPRPPGGKTAGHTDTASLAAELERAIADRIGMRSRAVVLSREELVRCVRDNPYPGETNPRLLHAVFLPEVPRPGLAAWVADAERQVRATGSQDEARVLGRTVYLYTPGRVPAQRTAPRARQGGRTDLERNGRNGAQLGDGQQAGRALRTLTGVDLPPGSVLAAWVAAPGRTKLGEMTGRWERAWSHPDERLLTRASGCGSADRDRPGPDVCTWPVSSSFRHAGSPAIAGQNGLPAGQSLPFLGARVTQRSPDSRCPRQASSDPAAQEEIPTTMCPAWIVSSACPAPHTGSTTTSMSASTSCSSTSSPQPCRQIIRPGDHHQA